MPGFVQDIEGLAIKNDDFRRVLYTAKNCQLVVMSLKPKEEIGAEVHRLDQFFRVEEGTGEAVLDGVRTAIRAGFAVVVPAGTNHNIVNTGSAPLKLYTIYAPPNHRDGVVHHTRDDVPDFIGSCRTDPDLWLDRRHPLARATPAVHANQPMPSRYHDDSPARWQS